MKKVVAVVATLLICMVALCACTPSEDSLKKKFEKEEYEVESVTSSNMNTYGLEQDKIDYCFMASKLSSANIVFVVSFKSGSDAKKYYDTISDTKSALGIAMSLAQFKVAKKGNAVIFGSEEAVKLI